jgi:hypothetical protein
MEAKQTKNNRSQYRTILSLRIRERLREYGFEPIMEVDNIRKPGFKCWKYKNTEELELALQKIMKEGGQNGR